MSGEEPRKKLRVLDDRTSQLLAISFNKLLGEMCSRESFECDPAKLKDTTSDSVVYRRCYRSFSSSYA